MTSTVIITRLSVCVCLDALARRALMLAMLMIGGSLGVGRLVERVPEVDVCHVTPPSSSRSRVAVQ